VGFFAVGDGSLLHEVLIDTDETNSVTARYIGDGFNFTSHHEHGSLDVLDVEVVLGAWGIVRSHDSDLLSSLDDS
jgi:anti-sigma factor ChrR (cupin superfamily)